MATIYTEQGSNIRKTWLLMGTFLVMVIAIGYAASWYLNSSAILYVAIIFALFMNIFSYWFSDKLVLSMTNAKQIQKRDYLELWNVVENLAITTGLPMPRVFVVSDPAPNAFATGRNPEHAVVAATTGLLQILDRTELEGVIAHEMSHIGNRDMLVMTVAVVLAGFVAMIADFFSRAMMFGGNGDDRRSPIFLILGIVGIILAPLAAKLLQLAVSRRSEYLADATGALTTRYPEGLASALEKISASHMPMQRASHATAHLFISDPFATESRRSIGSRISGLFASHPPAQERIKRLREMSM